MNEQRELGFETLFLPLADIPECILRALII